VYRWVPKAIALEPMVNAPTARRIIVRFLKNGVRPERQIRTQVEAAEEDEVRRRGSRVTNQSS
jgi:hypothetical protein